MRSDRTASAAGDPSGSSGGFGPNRGGLRTRRQSSERAGRRLDDGELAEVVIALDTRAPGAARTVVAACLGERIPTASVDNAQLLVSELVANSVRHSGSPVDDAVVVSVELSPDWFRIGVRDSGSNGVIAAQPPNLDTGGGFGLNLVELLSDRWGVERAATGTQVWAQVLRSPVAGADGLVARTG